jgi:hypothetical protein
MTARCIRVLKAKSRFINRPTKTGKKTYDKFFVYVPTDVAKDSAFPFKDGDEIEIEIDKQRRVLLIKPVRR